MLPEEKIKFRICISSTNTIDTLFILLVLYQCNLNNYILKEKDLKS